MIPVRFWDIVWSYYRSKQPNGTLMIVAIGAPNLIDVDSLRNATLLTDSGYDVIVPDYYGFCRSSRLFTPMNSIQTLLDTKNTFSWWIVTNVYSWEDIRVQYDRFIFLGLSYGWWVVPLLPKFDPTIQTIAMFYPVTDYSSFGKCGAQEETVEDFLNSIKRGFSTQYRGLDLPEWNEHFQDRLWLTPALNTEYLSWANIFLAHGSEDESIYYEKTKKYYQSLKQSFPNNAITYREYKGKKHGYDTMIPATTDLITWLKSIHN